MMFNFFRKDTDNKKLSGDSSKLHAPEFDGLNKTATQIAIDLIEGRGGRLYIQGMKQIFRKTPQLVEDVAPEYRDKLLNILEQD